MNAAGPLAEVAGLRRENLDERGLIVLERGGALGADVSLVKSDGGLVVVKDFARRGALVRASLGRWSIRREARVLTSLRDWPPSPQLLGRLGPYALVIEHRPGTRITRRRPWTFSPQFVHELRRCVAELHARGFVHLDLGHRNNIRCDLDGRPVVLDFASCLGPAPRGLLRQLVRAGLGWVDGWALRKWERWLLEAPEAGGD
jgi:hypothetical protein